MSENALYLVMLIAIKPGCEEEFSIFSKLNGPLLRDYGIVPLTSISTPLMGQLVGKNELPQPSVAAIFKLHSMEAFSAYMADAQYRPMSDMRAACTTSVIGYFARGLPLPEPCVATSNRAERLYVVGLASFKEGMEDGLDAFNNKALEEGLFAKHGMHIELQLQPFSAAVVVGDAQRVIPDRIQVFFVDRAENMKAYVADPLYQSLAPIRDNSLKKYDFFGGPLK
jgi:hypothetical protein